MSRSSIDRTRVRVTPSKILIDGHPLVDLERTVVVHRCALVVGIDKSTVVAVESCRETVLCLIRTGVHRNIVAVIQRRAEDLVHPVCAGYTHPRVLGSIPSGREIKPCVCIRRFTHSYLLLCVQRSRQVACLTYTNDTVVRNRQIAFFCFLGSYEHATAGTGNGTIDSSRSRVLQNHDVLDVSKRRNGRAGHTVYHPKHIVAVLRTLTTDNNVRSSCRSTAVGRNRHTRQLTLQHGFRRCNRTHRQFLSIRNHTYRSGKVLLLLSNTVTEDNHLVQLLRILNQRYVQCLTVPLNLLGNISDVRNLDNVTTLNSIQGEFTVHIGNSTDSRAFHRYVCSGNRTQRILNRTCHLPTLLGDARSSCCLRTNVRIPAPIKEAHQQQQTYRLEVFQHN